MGSNRTQKPICLLAEPLVSDRVAVQHKNVLCISGRSCGEQSSRSLDVKRPTRAVEELHQIAAIRTERRLFAQVDFRREMRPTAFVDPGAFSLTYLNHASEK